MSNDIQIIFFQFPVALTVDCALGGVNPSQMYLTGGLILAPRHPRARDLLQITVEQVCFITFFRLKGNLHSWNRLPLN